MSRRHKQRPPSSSSSSPSPKPPKYRNFSAMMYVNLYFILSILIIRTNVINVCDTLHIRSPSIPRSPSGSPQYVVVATMGHIRHLPAKPGSVDPANNFAMNWQPTASTRTTAAVDRILSVAASPALTTVLLATDPDREGEAISWHLSEVLDQIATSRTRSSASPSTPLSIVRVTFTEITEEAVRDALTRPRAISHDLVDAARARVALDYLVGFHVSPMLWQKIPGGVAKSAGRVQSVVLRLITEREAEREAFVPTNYYTVHATLRHRMSGDVIEADVIRIGDGDSDGGRGRGVAGGGNGDTILRRSATTITGTSSATDDRNRVGPGALPRADLADDIVTRLLGAGHVTVDARTTRSTNRFPPAPFTTSTLQQTAAGQLGLGITRTMSLAQELYEGGGAAEGLITYIRTDGRDLAKSAIEMLRKEIVARFGPEAVPDTPNVFPSKQKNAQEAHEAIRPTRADRDPEILPSKETWLRDRPDLIRLYGLIWSRSVACQMTPAVLQTESLDAVLPSKTSTSTGTPSVDTHDDWWVKEGAVRLRARGTRVVNPGFMAVLRGSWGGRAGEECEGGECGEEGGEGGVGQKDAGEGTGDRPSASSSSQTEGILSGEQVANVIASIVEGDLLEVVSARKVAHTTQPPPRYTEASLVKTMEASGIGRPSTYAPTLSMLRSREYVRMEGRALVPTPMGRIITEFLKEYIDNYFNYEFTNDMERQLDEISAGKVRWTGMMEDFWGVFDARIQDVLSTDREVVLARLSDRLLPILLRPYQAQARRDGNAYTDANRVDLSHLTEAEDPHPYPHVCPRCREGRLSLVVTKSGGTFIGCSNYQTTANRRKNAKVEQETKKIDTTKENPRTGSTESCDFSVPAFDTGGAEMLAALAAGKDCGLPVILGTHPAWGSDLVLRSGPYGTYVETIRDRGTTLRAAVPEGRSLLGLTVSDAVSLLDLKEGRDVGEHPGTKSRMVMKSGRYGPFLDVQAGEELGRVCVSIPVRYRTGLESESERNRDRDRENPKDTENGAWDDVMGADVGAGKGRGGRKSTKGTEELTVEAAVALVDKKLDTLRKIARGEIVPRGRFGAKEKTAGVSSSDPPTKKASRSTVRVPTKRTKSAYLLFCDAMRPQVRKMDPSLGIGAVAKELGRRWALVSADERRGYEDLARAEAEAANPMTTKSQESTPKPKQRRAPSAYILFSLAKRAEVLASLPEDRRKPTDVLSALGAAWRAATAEERRMYEGQSAAAKEAIRNEKK